MSRNKKSISYKKNLNQMLDKHYLKLCQDQILPIYWYKIYKDLEKQRFKMIGFLIKNKNKNNGIS